MGDRDSLSINYEIEPEVASSGKSSPGVTNTGQITIDVSRTLQKLWAMEKSPLENFLIGYAKDFASSKIESSSDLSNERIQLTSYNAPEMPPIESPPIVFTIPLDFQVTIPEPDKDVSAYQINQARDIIDARDNINAVFGEKFGDRLLSITQERALFELSRQCNTREEFAFRTSSLAGLAVAINTSAIESYIDSSPHDGSINKLGLFLRTEYPKSDSSAIMETISKFNQVRRMFPVHTDRTEGVISALNYFGIKYPVEDFQKAIVAMLGKYLDCLDHLLVVLNPK